MGMVRIVSYKDIDRGEWETLVRESATGTWFQSAEAYALFASLPELFEPFVVGIQKPSPDPSLKGGELQGICVGYVTKERSRLKQFFTGRAIIPGGPCLADDATDEEVTALMRAVSGKNISNLGFQISNLSKRVSELGRPIYIETRNFNDYSRWKGAFAEAGFAYKPHLNFHVDCRDKAMMWERLSDNRKRQIRRGFFNLGFQISNFKFEDCYLDSLERSAQSRADLGFLISASLERSAKAVQISDFKLLDEIVTEQDVREWYAILEKLYRTKVKTPLWPVEFFLAAHRQGVGQFILIRHEGKIIGGSMVVRKPTPGPSLKGGEMEKAGENGVVYEWYECGMNAEYKEQYPSVMATWAGMLYAHEQGCARYDMMGAGEPGVPYGVRDFKSEFGGQMVEHGRYLCICKPALYKIGCWGVKLLRG